ncbi:hypothetical protein [Mycobacterium tuberculosis]|uniref:hypothetical protein n=1 Tax=Mycobacterium tuberculosis TaxID=1773 RepID=UPI0032B417DD
MPCTHIGPDGSGHFVEWSTTASSTPTYSSSGEAYQLMRDRLGLTAPAIADVFTEWNNGDLDGYLVEITAEVLRQQTCQDRQITRRSSWTGPSRKGTGFVGPSSPRWTWTYPVTGIASGVCPRSLGIRGATLGRQRSGFGQARRAALPTPPRSPKTSARRCTPQDRGLRSGGFNQIQAGSARFGWDITPGDLAIWRGGCIIGRSSSTTSETNGASGPNLASLISPVFPRRRRIGDRQLAACGVDGGQRKGIPTPGFSSALSYYDALRTAQLPTTLTQASATSSAHTTPTAGSTNQASSTRYGVQTAPGYRCSGPRT